jgi:hypothetical protein
MSEKKFTTLLVEKNKHMHHQRINLEKTATIGLLGLYNLCGNQAASREFEKTAGLPGKILFGNWLRNLFSKKGAPAVLEKSIRPEQEILLNRQKKFVENLSLARELTRNNLSKKETIAKNLEQQYEKYKLETINRIAMMKKLNKLPPQEFIDAAEARANDLYRQMSLAKTDLQKAQATFDKANRNFLNGEEALKANIVDFNKAEQIARRVEKIKKTLIGLGIAEGGLLAGGVGAHYLKNSDTGVSQQSLNPAAGGVPSENPFKAPATIPQASQQAPATIQQASQQAPVKAPATIPQASQQNLFEDPPEVSFDDPLAGMTQNRPEDFVGSMLKTLPKKPLASQQAPIEPLIRALAAKPEINQGILFRSLAEQPQVSQQTQFENPPEVPVENPTAAPVETPTQLPPDIQQKEIGKNTPTPQIPGEKGNFPWLPLAAGIPAAGLGLYGLSRLMSRRDKDKDERKRRVYVQNQPVEEDEDWFGGRLRQVQQQATNLKNIDKDLLLGRLKKIHL